MKQQDEFYRDAWAEINLDAIGDNVRTFRHHLPEDVKIMAVVKADGYGHGAHAVAEKALEEGADYLGVALLDEALELREKGISSPILVLSSFPSRGIELALNNDITMTVYQHEMLDNLIKAAEASQKTARIHIKLDTGMGRIGIRTLEELDSFIQLALTSPWVRIEGIFTHFATADEEETGYLEEQRQGFKQFIEHLEEQNIKIPLVHCNNSAGAMFYPGESMHMIRLGIALYGQYPSPYAKTTGIRLQPAFQWKARISHIKWVGSNSKISYGATFATKAESVIATIPIGYADGYNRLLSNRGFVLVKGKRAPIVGRICMDQFMVDVTHIEDVCAGDEVVLIGRQGSEEISVDEMAGWLSTINYEVTCMVSKRIPRIYYEKGEKVSITDRFAAHTCKD
jgi:alanine racemase